MSKEKKETMKSKYDENKILIQKYLDFLFSECAEDERLKLIAEIAKIEWQCIIIEEMEQKKEYQVFTAKKSRTSDDEKDTLWWGYRHRSGSYQAKRFFLYKDIQEALKSPFVIAVSRPFAVPDNNIVNPREHALNYLKSII